MKRKTKIVSVVLLSLLVAGIATASLLEYFGVITTTADVGQSIMVDGKTGQASISHTIGTVIAGEEVCYLHKIKNQALVDINVDFTNSDNAGNDNSQVITSLYDMRAKTTILNLCNKNSTWQCEDSPIRTATLTFDSVNPKFKGTLITSGLIDGVTYALIYYTDEDPRFAPEKWGGKDGKIITTFTGAQSNGVGGLTIDVDLGMNLPSSPDWNINPSPNYCLKHNGFDSYAHCRGAKIWIVPTSDLTNSNSLPVINWGNHGDWLFEKDLITYSDCDLPDFPTNIQFYGEQTTNIESSLTIPSETTVPIMVCYDFDKNAHGTGYQMTTTIG